MCSVVVLYNEENKNMHRQLVSRKRKNRENAKRGKELEHIKIQKHCKCNVRMFFLSTFFFIFFITTFYFQKESHERINQDENAEPDG